MVRTVDIFTSCNLPVWVEPDGVNEVIPSPFPEKIVKTHLNSHIPTLYRVFVCLDKFDQTMLHIQMACETFCNDRVILRDDYKNFHKYDKIETHENVIVNAKHIIKKYMISLFKFIISLKKAGIHKFEIVDVDCKQQIVKYQECIDFCNDIKQKNEYMFKAGVDTLHDYLAECNQMLLSCVDMSPVDSLKLLAEFTEKQC